MTRDETYGLNIMTADGAKHTFYGYDEQPDTAVTESIGIKTPNGTRYIPLTTLEKENRPYPICIQTETGTRYLVEDKITFTVKFQSEYHYSLKITFESDTLEKVTINIRHRTIIWSASNPYGYRLYEETIECTTNDVIYREYDKNADTNQIFGFIYYKSETGNKSYMFTTRPNQTSDTVTVKKYN